MARKIRPGDVFEIETKKGLAYGQYLLEHREPPKYGPLVGIFAGTYESRPPLDQLLHRPVSFKFFIPLQTYINRGTFQVIGNADVAEEHREFPLFRGGIVDPRVGKVVNWWLWDGKNEWMIGPLPPEQRKLPIRGVCNDIALIEKIESGWTPENDPTT